MAPSHRFQACHIRRGRESRFEGLQAAGLVAVRHCQITLFHRQLCRYRFCQTLATRRPHLRPSSEPL